MSKLQSAYENISTFLLATSGLQVKSKLDLLAMNTLLKQMEIYTAIRRVHFSYISTTGQLNKYFIQSNKSLDCLLN